MNVIKNNAFVRYSLVCVISFAIAWFCLPTKTVTKEVKVEVVKNVYIKTKVQEDIVTTRGKDGTITTHTKRNIDTLDNSKETARSDTYEKTEINKKYFGLEAGYTLRRTAYVHVTYDIMSHLFIGMHADLNTSTNVADGGVGVGIRL